MQPAHPLVYSPDAYSFTSPVLPRAKQAVSSTTQKSEQAGDSEDCAGTPAVFDSPYVRKTRGSRGDRDSESGRDANRAAHPRSQVAHPATSASEDCSATDNQSSQCSFHHGNNQAQASLKKKGPPKPARGSVTSGPYKLPPGVQPAARSSASNTVASPHRAKPANLRHARSPRSPRHLPISPLAQCDTRANASPKRRVTGHLNEQYGNSPLALSTGSPLLKSEACLDGSERLQSAQSHGVATRAASTTSSSSRTAGSCSAVFEDEIDLPMTLSPRSRKRRRTDEEDEGEEVDDLALFSKPSNIGARKNKKTSVTFGSSGGDEENQPPASDDQSGRRPKQVRLSRGARGQCNDIYFFLECLC